MSRFGALALLSLSLSFASCRCNDKVQQVDVCRGVEGAHPDHPNACGTNADCPDHYACVAPKDGKGHGCCLFVDRKCTTEADCCPGQTCPAERKKCFDKYLQCDTDADCGDKGDRFCEEWTDSYGTSKRCRFKPCGPLGDCPEGLSCFQGECMADLPCGGSCEPGKACVPAIDRCQDYSNPTQYPDNACPVSCNAGFIATFKDNRDIWDTCNLPKAQCVCAELPPLRSSDLGRWSSLATDPKNGHILVSAYDGEYGDLVVYRFGADGKLMRLDWVDGVPSGTAKYGPSGPRKGIVEPGDDVGRYTDIAVNGDYAYVSYYDVTNGDLKLAVRGPDGSWNTVKVDGFGADLGLYTSVAVDSDGLPAISYFQRSGSADFDVAQCPDPKPTGDKSFITALKLAHATRPDPQSGADFTVKTLACQSRRAPPCFNCQQVCADPGSGPGCYAADTTCTGCDPNTETCVLVGTAPRCAKKYNPSSLNEVVDGVGLFTSLTFKGKDAHIVYMKRTTPAAGGLADGDLYGISIGAQGTVRPAVLLDGNGDVGFFPDVKVDPAGSLAVSYHDFTSRQLRFWAGSVFAPGATPEVIDSGAGPAGSGESNWVGTDSAVVFTGTPGQVFVVYQDATRGDLKIASRGASWQELPPLRTEGAVGFFADGAFLNGKLYASHARIRAKLVSGEPRVDNALLLEQLTAP